MHAARTGTQYLHERLLVYDALYHDHLPVLCDAGVVTNDRDTDIVDLGPAAERVEPAAFESLPDETVELLQAEERTFDPFPE